MDSAAIAMRATSEAATSARVTPRCFEFASLLSFFLGRRMSGESIRDPSVFVKRRGGYGQCVGARSSPSQRVRHVVELPLVSIGDGYAGSDQIKSTGSRGDWVRAASVDGKSDSVPRAAITVGGVCPREAGDRRHRRRQTAVVDLFGYQIFVHHLKGVADRCRDRRGRAAEVVRRIGGSHAGGLTGSVG